MDDPYAPLPVMPLPESIPHRPRQPEPTDPLQARLRLLTEAIQTLAAAASSLSAHRRTGPSQMMTAEQAITLTRQVARLGGWAESLLPVGVPIRTDDGWVVLE